jgi:hypothetical protein
MAQGDTMTKISVIAACLLPLACTEQFPKERPAAAAAPTSTTIVQPKRTLERRTLYGASAERNLMVDGDFELTGRSQQMPWLSFGTNGQATLNYETGGLCRAGIRCAVMKTDEQLIGWFASPKDGMLAAEVYLFPKGAECSAAATVAVFDLDDQGSSVELTASGDPDANGWCLFRAVVPAIPLSSPVMYVKSKIDGLRIDSARVVETPKGSRVVASTLSPVSAAQRASFLRIATIVRRTRIYGLQQDPSMDNVVPESKLRR